MDLPPIIQGGMGAGVSGWRLANAVASLGQLGVVSGTALDAILARRLQDGDPGGAMRRALSRFPFPGVAKGILDRYFLEGGRAPGRPYRDVPMHSLSPSRALLELTVAANFVEVSLAREGHEGPVGINYLEKIQLPLLPSLYGALLAGVDVILMGAGIPVAVPGVLERLVRHEAAVYPIAVSGPEGDPGAEARFDPKALFAGPFPELVRPRFLPIIASNLLATVLLRKASGPIDGFVVEGPTSGGHNAPPRGRLQLDASGQPVYGERDRVDLEAIRALGLPFWTAGGCGSAGALKEARAAGAAGVQVGTAFALCEESGLAPDLRKRLLAQAREGLAEVRTDVLASPAGFPFKVARLEGTLSEEDVYRERGRVCDLGYLRTAFRKEDGSVGFRCPAEPVANYVRAGGDPGDAEGRKCLCNGLMADIGLGQLRPGDYVEPPLVTCGEAIRDAAAFLPEGKDDYRARDVVERLLLP